MIRLSLLALLLACGSRRDDQPAPSPPPAAPRVVDPPPVERAPRPTTTAPGWASITTIAKGNVRADSLAIDSKGDVVVAVSFKDRITVGDQTFTSDEGVVLVKLAPDGSVRWAKLLGAGRTVEHARIAIDSKDALAIAATMRSSVDLGGGTLASAGEKDILIAKLTADGTHVWSKRYGGGEPDRPADIAVDAKDHIVVGGYYADSVDFGGKKLHSKHDAEMFVARYAPDGKLVFANRISGGGTRQSELYDVAVDAKGNVIAIGGFGDKVDLTGATLTGDKLKASQTFVVAYAPTGRVAWSAAFGEGALTLMNAVATTSSGHVVLAGTDMNVPVDQNDMVAFDPASGQPKQGSMRTLLAVLGSDHKRAWSLPVADAGIGDSLAIAIAENEDIVLAGDGQSPPFGDAKHADARTFIARVSAAGKLVWLRAIPNASDITASPDVAIRGSTIVIAAQTGEGDAKALALLRPE